MARFDHEITSEYLQANAQQLDALAVCIEARIDSNDHKTSAAFGSSIDDVRDVEGLITVEEFQKRYSGCSYEEAVEEVMGENIALVSLAKSYITRTRIAYAKGIEIAYPALYHSGLTEYEAPFESAHFKSLDLETPNQEVQYGLCATELTAVGVFKGMRLFRFNHIRDGVKEDISITSADRAPIDIKYSIGAVKNSYWDYAGELVDNDQVMDHALEIEIGRYSKEDQAIKVAEIMTQYRDNLLYAKIEKFLNFAGDFSRAWRESIAMSNEFGPNLPSAEKLEEITKFLAR